MNLNWPTAFVVVFGGVPLVLFGTAVLVAYPGIVLPLLATVLGAVDLGYRTVLVTDAVCSASDSAHDAMLELFGNRYRRHVEIATTEEVCDAWDRGR